MQRYDFTRLYSSRTRENTSSCDRIDRTADLCNDVAYRHRHSLKRATLPKRSFPKNGIREGGGCRIIMYIGVYILSGYNTVYRDLSVIFYPFDCNESPVSIDFFFLFRTQNPINGGDRQSLIQYKMFMYVLYAGKNPLLLPTGSRRWRMLLLMAMSRRKKYLIVITVL